MIVPEVYYYDFSAAGRSLSCLKPFLSDERYSYCAKMKNETAALRSAYGYMLLRLALKQKYGITEMPSFYCNEYGKPFLTEHPDIFFNISHSGKSVVCAVSEEPVGIDIQDIRHLSFNVGNKFLTDEELGMVTGLEPADLDRELCRIWCIKESYGKMTGKASAKGSALLRRKGLSKKTKHLLNFITAFL